MYRIPYQRVEKFLTFTPEKDVEGAEEYVQYHTERSLTIWANYLSSLSLFVRFKKYISVLTKTEIYTIEKKDIRYLIGIELADELYELLNNWLQSEKEMSPLSINYSEIYTNSFKEILIPAEYESVFMGKIMKDYYTNNSIDELVSRHFYHQHRFIEKISRRMSLSAFTRLRYGVTFRGLHNDLSFYSGKRGEKIDIELHRAMDKQIDEGSVVPKYIKLKNNNRDIWVRMFRSGERIPKYIELYNLCNYLLYELNNRVQLNVPVLFLEVYLLHFLTNSVAKEEWIDLYDYSIKRKKKKIAGFPVYCATLEIDRKEVFVSEWLEKQKLIEFIDNEDKVRINITSKPDIIPYGDVLIDDE
ncbi:MAG: hypothetical protein LUG98_05680, partial [Tannerellaceae bacterium]|nr:hypothetical protein [Tannerellaceae bacterium]